MNRAYRIRNLILIEKLNFDFTLKFVISLATNRTQQNFVYDERRAKTDHCKITFMK